MVEATPQQGSEQPMVGLAHRESRHETTVADLPRSRWKSARLEVGTGYLWFFAAIAAFNPYVAMFYRSPGFTGLQVGMLTAMPAIGLALSGTFWGTIMDQLGIHRTVLRWALVLCAIFAVVVAQMHDFARMFVFVTALSFSQVPLRALLDSYAVGVSERVGSTFGSIRSWGAVGYFVSVLVLGRLMGDEVSNLFLYAYALFMIVTFICLMRLPHLAERQPVQYSPGLQELMGNRALLLLLAVGFLLAVGYAVIYVALGIHIQSIGGTTDLVGIAFAVGAAAELPAFLFGGKLIRKIGERRVILAAIAFYGIRYTLIGLITNPNWIVPVQGLHMLSFAAFLVASVPLAHKIVLGEHPATTQALLTTFSFGFGNIVGSVGGGWMLDAVDSSTLFLTVAGLMVLTLVIFLVGSRAVCLDERVHFAERRMRGLDQEAVAP
jgi:PPP family 3-phenylpropionic acid transporter